MNNFQENTSYNEEVWIDQATVTGYAELLGDKNPLHLDKDYAAKTKFGKPIAHGGILFGQISRILGMKFPGPGTVYLSQLINFHNPVFIGDKLRFELIITEQLPKDGATINIRVIKTTGELVADGTAKIKMPNWCVLHQPETVAAL